MARYAEDHKRATRQRIVDTAGRRFKSDGVDGSGVSTLMADAGLTNGAFYVHFGSKADLVATVVSEQLEAQRAAAAALPAGADGLRTLVRRYLSAEHRDHPGDGCPSAALVEEIARGSDDVRAAYSRGVLDFVDVIVGFLGPAKMPATRATQRVRVLATFASMVGTLQMARTITDPVLSDALLAQGIDNALHTLGLPASTRTSPSRTRSTS